MRGNEGEEKENQKKGDRGEAEREKCVAAERKQSLARYTFPHQFITHISTQTEPEAVRAQRWELVEHPEHLKWYP